MKLVNGQNAVLLSDSEKKELNEILDKVYEFYSAKNPQDSGYFVTWDGAGAFFIQYFDQYLMRNAIPAS